MITQRMPIRRRQVALAAAVLLAAAAASSLTDDADRPPPAAAQAPAVVPTFGLLPLAIVPNAGQADPWATHVVRGGRASVLFGPGGLSLRLASSPPPAPCDRMVVDGVCWADVDRPAAPDALAALDDGARAGDALRGTVDAVGLVFVGGRPDALPVAEAPTGGTWSRFSGPREDWLRGLPIHGRVVYRAVWPGIDVAFDGTDRRLKHTFTVAPGADPAAIALAWRGAAGVAIRADGAIVARTAAGDIVDEAPIAWQDVGGRRVAVDVRYRLAGGDDGRYGFAVGTYNPALPLVIDPAVVVSAGWLGGEERDRGLGIEVDAQRNTYVTGEFGRNAFVTKIDPTGTRIVWTLEIVAAGGIAAFDIDVDAHGAAYVVGATGSDETSLPVTGGPDLTYGGGQLDAWVAKVAPEGTDLIYLGYIGGAGADFAEGVAVDADGAAYVSGDVDSTERTFPVKIGPDVTHNGKVDAFVVKIAPEPFAAVPVDNLVWGGFIGGAGNDVAVYPRNWSAGHIAIDRDRNVYLSNTTDSDQRTFPDGDGFGDIPGPDRTFNGVLDAYIVKIRADGTGLVYAGYVGGTGDDDAKGMAVDDAGAAYFTGAMDTSDGSFPVTVGPDLSYNGGADAYVAKVKPDGSGLAYLGFVGGDNDDYGQAVALGPDGALYVTGWTRSTEATFPLVGGPDRTFNTDAAHRAEENVMDAFVGRLKLDPSAPDPAANWDYMGLIGGNLWDAAFWLDVDDAGAAYVVGDTFSDRDTFPGGDGMGTIPGPAGGAKANMDAFVAKVAWREVQPRQQALLPWAGRGATRDASSAPVPFEPTASATRRPLPTFTPTHTASPPPRPTAAVTVPAGEEVVLFDDFEDVNSGWPLYDFQQEHVRYAEGGLDLIADGANVLVRSVAPVGMFGDGAFEATMRRVGDSGAFYGLGFGPPSLGFMFFVFSDGTYGIYELGGGGAKTHQGKRASAAIARGTAPNRLRVEREGATVTLYVNGERLRTFEHPLLVERGGAVLMLQAVGDGAATARFDDVLITRFTADRPTVTPTPEPPMAPTPTPEPTRPAGAILFQDDFGDPTSGWITADDAQRRMRYVNGAYEVAVREPELFVVGLAPQVRCANCTVESDVRFASAVVGTAGIVLGENISAALVTLQIQPDGTYLVERYNGTAWQTLVDLTASSALLTGAGAVNRLKAVRKDGRVTFFANDVELRTLDVAGLTAAGRAGVIVTSLAARDVVVRFDDFVVREGGAPPLFGFAPDDEAGGAQGDGVGGSISIVAERRVMGR